MPNKRHRGLYTHYQAFDLPDGTKAGLTEFDLMVCNHCNRIVVLNPERTRSRGYCPNCDMYTCDECTAFDRCIPTEQRIELALKYPELNLPWLDNGPGGVPLFDLELLDKERIF